MKKTPKNRYQKVSAKSSKKDTSVVPLKPDGGFEVIEYASNAGKNAYKKWFDDLPATHATKVTDAVRRMEAGNLGDHHGVGEGVFEHRMFNPALRVYFGKDGAELIILLAGGGKRNQGKDIEKAKKLWQEYKGNKKKDNKKQ